MRRANGPAGRGRPAARAGGRVLRVALGWNRRMLKLTRVTHGRLLPRRPTLLIASTPKSGSTFLAAALREATGYEIRFLGEHFMSEQDLSEGRVLDALPVPAVVHQHCTATKATLDIVRRYDLTVLMQYRRLDDTIASVRDKLDTDPWIGPAFHAGPGFHALDEAAKIDAIVALAAPRFIRLYASWWAALARGEVRGRMMSYDEIVADKPGALQAALEGFGQRLDRDTAAAAVARVESDGATRFNRGAPGRGGAILTDAHRAFLARLTAPYPWVDFRPIGLDGPTDPEAVLSGSLGRASY